MPAYITGLNIVAKVTDGQVSQHIGNDLGIDVNPFYYEFSGVKGYFGGAADEAVVDGYTNYVYLNADGYLTQSLVEYPSVSHIRLARVITLDGVISSILDDRSFFTATSTSPVPGPHASTHEFGGSDYVLVENLRTAGGKGKVPMSDGSNGLDMKLPWGSKILMVGADFEYTSIKAALTAAAGMSPSLYNMIVIQVTPGFYVEDNSAGPLELIDFVHINGPGQQNAAVVVPAVNTNYLFRSSENGYGSINALILYGCSGETGGGILVDRGANSAYLHMNFTGCTVGVRITGYGTQAVVGICQFISCYYGVVSDTYGVAILSSVVSTGALGSAFVSNGGLLDIDAFTLVGNGADIAFYADNYGMLEVHDGKVTDFGTGVSIYNGGDVRLELVRISGSDAYDVFFGNTYCSLKTNASEFATSKIYNPGSPILGQYRDPVDNILKNSGSLDLIAGPDSWFGFSRMTTAQQSTMTSGWDINKQGRAWFNTSKHKFVFWDGYHVRYIVPSQVVTVAKEGADYTSIKSAIDSITDASASKPYTVLVNAGIYYEVPFTLKQYVSLQALGKGACVICALTQTSPLITMVNSTELNGFTFMFPTASSVVYINNIDKTAISNCQFQFDYTSIYATGPSAEVYIENCKFLTAGAPITNAVLVENGAKVIARGLTITALSGVKSNGGNIEIQDSSLVSCVSGLYADNGGNIEFNSLDLDLNTYSIRTGATGINEIMGVSAICKDTAVYDIYQQNTDSKIVISNSFLNDEKFSISDWDNVKLSFDSAKDDGYEYIIVRDIGMGVPERGSFTRIGRGAPYIRGMNVFTTDSTASSINDGGNLIDVSEYAKETGETFTFQGVDANYSILLGCDLSDGYDVLKHFGFRFLQTTAAVESTKRSFMFEIWNGSAWVEINVLDFNRSNLYKYANEVFLRENSDEKILYGINSSTVWAKKSISGKELYWSRIRIKYSLTTAPVFDHFRLMPSSTIINEDGLIAFSGRARFKIGLNNFQNSFGDEGGVATSNINVGSGGVPTGWYQRIPKSLMNWNGDAIQCQFTLPDGVDTSMPLSLVLNYSVTNIGTGNATFIASMLPIEIQGVLEADPNGGAVPVARTLANTETMTGKQSQTVTNTQVATSVSTKLQSAYFEGFSVANYYEGDMVVFRIEMDNRAGSNIAAWSVDVVGTLCSLGKVQ